MTEQFSLWITSDLSSWESPPTLKVVRRRLTKMARSTPENATVTIKKEAAENGHTYTRIAAHWYEWR